MNEREIVGPAKPSEIYREWPLRTIPSRLLRNPINMHVVERIVTEHARTSTDLWWRLEDITDRYLRAIWELQR